MQQSSETFARQGSGRLVAQGRVPKLCRLAPVAKNYVDTMYDPKLGAHAMIMTNIERNMWSKKTTTDTQTQSSDATSPCAATLVFSDSLMVMPPMLAP